MKVAVDTIGLACCGIEVATAMERFAGSLGDLELVAHAPGLTADLRIAVIAGTVTNANVEFVRERIAALAEPRAVMAYGVCAASGGPYWDSYAVTQGWPTPDLLVPGCPPRPEALVTAVVQLADQVQHAAR